MNALMVSDPSADSLKGFRTYLNYLSAIRDSFREEYGTFEPYIDQCLHATRRLKGDKTLDSGYVERYLRLAWNTEYLLHLSGNEDPEIQRLNNHWAPVQAYYAVYCAVEASGYALDGNRPQSHAKAIGKITEYLRRLDLQPWQLVATGPRGKDGKETELEGLPEDVEIPNNLQVHDVEPAGMIARCLGAEHKHRIDDLWQSKARSGCWKYQYDPGPTGLLHFLYRLRIKANYREVDVFLAEATEREVLDFSRRLRFLVCLALTLMEVIAMRKLGKKAILEMGERFLASNDQASLLERRLELYRQLV